MKAWSASWNQSAPFYPAYYLQDRLVEFLAMHDAFHIANNGNVSQVYLDLAVVSPEGVVSQEKRPELVHTHAPFGRVFELDTAELDSLTVFSDGLLALSDADGPLDLVRAAGIMTAYKGSAGRFVTRRSIAAFRRDIQGLPGDDFSAAGIWLGE